MVVRKIDSGDKKMDSDLEKMYFYSLGRFYPYVIGVDFDLQIELIGNPPGFCN